MKPRIFDRTNRARRALGDDILATATTKSTKRALPAIGRILVGGCVVFTVLFLIAQFSPLVPWYARTLAGVWNDPDGDILIVLTSDQQSDGIIGTVSYWRAVYAIRTWREGHFRAVVVSGGYTPGSQRSLASVLGEFLVAYGIPKEKIFLEERSTNTRENALYTKEMISSWPGRKVLLTSDFHMFRAQRVFDAVGLPVSPRPFPDILKHQAFPVLRISDAWGLCIETAKIAVYWERGWIHLP